MSAVIAYLFGAAAFAIAARIIHRHGGDISAEASLGKGTTVTLTL